MCISCVILSVFALFAASRLGRRPKRLKEAQEGASHRSHQTTPIAPYPPLSPQQLSRLSMAELQRLLQSLGRGSGMGGVTVSVQQPVLADGATVGGAKGSDEGYNSQGGDTPPSIKSHSPASAPGSVGLTPATSTKEEKDLGNVCVKQEPDLGPLSPEMACMVNSLVGHMPGDLNSQAMVNDRGTLPPKSSPNYIASLSSLSLSITDKELEPPRTVTSPVANRMPSPGLAYNPGSQGGSAGFYQRQSSTGSSISSNSAMSQSHYQRHMSTGSTSSVTSYEDLDCLPPIPESPYCPPPEPFMALSPDSISINPESHFSQQAQFPGQFIPDHITYNTMPVDTSTSTPQSTQPQNIRIDSNLPEIKSESGLSPQGTCVYSGGGGGSPGQVLSIPFASQSVPFEPIVSSPSHLDSMPALEPSNPQLYLGGLLQRAKQTPTRDQQLLIEQTLEKVIGAHMDTCIYTADKIAEGMRKYQEMQRDGPVRKPYYKLLFSKQLSIVTQDRYCYRKSWQ